jgi:predicted Zn-dependent peptidase
MQTAVSPPSFSRFDLPGDFHLALNSNRKMKTVFVSATFIGDLDEAVTRRAILPMILRRGTRRLPDMQSINRHLEGLYGASVASHVQKIGEWHLVRFRLEVVNEKFLPGEEGLLRKAVELLVELLEDPLISGGGFHAGYLEQEKANLERSIRSLVDDKRAYADHRLVEEMCATEPYRLHEQGRIEDIPAIAPEPLLRFHEDCTRSQPLHVYVAGDIDIEATRDLVAGAFAAGRIGRRGGRPIRPVPAPVPVKEPRSVSERMDLNQARLVLGYRHGVTFADPAYEALLVMNGVLGGYSHSKLFQNVREKANLCYGIHSGLERTKGLLFISSGIAPENHGRALEIILEQVRAMKAGEITAEEISSTISTILNHNEMLEDNLGALADVDFVWRLHGRTVDLPAFRERVRRIRVDEVVDVARRLELDTTYLLTSAADRTGIS